MGHVLAVLMIAVSHCVDEESAYHSPYDLPLVPAYLSEMAVQLKFSGTHALNRTAFGDLN
jgi:hypothetical protein